MDEERDRQRASDSDESAKSSGFVSASSYAGLGVQFVLAILLFLYAGRWVDSKLHTDPLFLIIGVFVGAASGFFVMYRGLVANSARRDRSPRR